MTTAVLKTNLRCAACVEAIRPMMDSEPTVQSWSVDLTLPEKPITITSENITAAIPVVTALLQGKGYTVQAEAPPEAPTSYFPLLLILGYLLLIVGIVEIAAGRFEAMRAMNHFMAGFFLVFSFFKLLNVTAFASAYSGYDLLAKLWPGYGYLYPFLELALGLLYLGHFWPWLTNIFAIGLMSVSTLGVVTSLLKRTKIRCACLGAVFNLPMSYVTLTEDLLMLLMAIVMLFLLQ